jgi:uroporphyrinogen decarboxylase
MHSITSLEGEAPAEPNNTLDMTSRDRVIAAVEHRGVDRIPVMITYLEEEMIRAARVRDANELRDRHRCDIRFVRFEALPRHGEVDRYLTALRTDAFVGDAWQLKTYADWSYAPPTADDPAGGNPLAGAQCAADIDAFTIPDTQIAGALEDVRRQVEAFQARDLATAGFPPNLGGELFETCQRLRGFERFCEDLIHRPDIAEYLLDRLTEVHIECAAIIAHSGSDILCLDDDMAHPTGLLISPGMYRRYFKPRMARIIEAARAVSPSIKVFYHSDGDISAILDDLVEIGIDVLEPVEPDCMDPLAIRKRYGTRLAFWGTVGSAAMWAYGTVRDVWDEVKLRIGTLGPTGLILAPAYDFTRDFGVDKLKAFFAAAKEYGRVS